MRSAVVAMLALATVLGNVQGHSYSLGSCPQVDPVPNFDMNKFMGTWYVIQKTSTASTCIVNNFTRTTDGELRLEQASVHFLLGIGRVDHIYRYTGILKQPDRTQPASLRVKFPLSVAGDAAYTVFMTDYETYAGVFTCQRLAFANRQSASILSRTPSLEKTYIDKIRNKLSSYGIDPHDLSIINQKDCKSPLAEETGVAINIDESTFTAESVAHVVRKAGEKIGDGIETVANGARNVYNRVSGSPSGSLTVDSDKDAEWLP